MKAMSKIFIKVACVCAVIGFVICIFALIIAKSSGVLLFSAKKDGMYYYTVSLEESDISRITVNATDVNVCVYTGCEHEYVDFINFDDNYYSVSTTNSVLNFNESVDMSSLVSFWDGSFSFKGMRNLLGLGGHPRGDKAINVYISDTREMEVLHFSIQNGNISIDPIDKDVDFLFSFDNGSLVLDQVKTKSGITVKGNGVTATFNGCSAESLNVDCGTFNMSGKIDNLNELTVNTNSGSINSDITLEKDPFDINVVSKGSIMLNDIQYTGTYSNNSDNTKIDDTYAKVQITGDDLGVTLNYSVSPTAVKAETEDTKK